MDIDLNCLYEDAIVYPLLRVGFDEVEPNCTYITKDGSRIKILEDMDVILIKRSPLNEGETVSSLSGEKAIKLFFKLLNTQ